MTVPLTDDDVRAFAAGRLLQEDEVARLMATALRLLRERDEAHDLLDEIGHYPIESSFVKLPRDPSRSRCRGQMACRCGRTEEGWGNVWNRAKGSARWKIMQHARAVTRAVSR